MQSINASYYCVKQYGHREVRAAVRRRRSRRRSRRRKAEVLAFDSLIVSVAWVFSFPSVCNNVVPVFEYLEQYMMQRDTRVFYCLPLTEAFIFPVDNVI